MDDSLQQHLKRSLACEIDTLWPPRRQAGPMDHGITQAAMRLSRIAAPDPAALRDVVIGRRRPTAVTSSIENLILLEALDAVDPQAHLLHNVVRNENAEVNVRRGALLRVVKRRSPALLEALVPLIEEPRVHSVLRRDLVYFLVENRVRDTLPAIQRLSPTLLAIHSKQQLTWARATLGDWTALRDSIEAAYLSPSAPVGGGELLQHEGGLPKAVDVLLGQASLSLEDGLRRLAGHESAALRAWAVHHLGMQFDSRASDTLIATLGDDEPPVVRKASAALANMKNRPAAQLRAAAADSTAPNEQRLWAIYTLQRLGETAKDLLDLVPHSSIALPTPVSPVMRDAILHKWARDPQDNADVRWLIEAQNLPERQPYDHATALANLRVALQDHDVPLRPRGSREWLSSDEPHLCVNLDVEGDTLLLSRIGPFAAYLAQLKQDRCTWWTNHSPSISAHDPTGERTRRVALCERVCAMQGLTWVDHGLMTQSLRGFPCEVGVLLFTHVPLC